MGHYLFSGSSSFDHTFHVGRAIIGDRERLMNQMEDTIDRQWLSKSGAFAQNFEEDGTEYLYVMTCLEIQLYFGVHAEIVREKGR